MTDETYDKLHAAIIADFVAETNAPKTGAFFLLLPDTTELADAYHPPGRLYTEQDEDGRTINIGTTDDFEAEFRLRNNGVVALVFTILPWG